jgi:DHA1 family multidrug resistance protein-like MFS transporter
MGAPRKTSTTTAVPWKRILIILAFNQLASTAGFSSVFPFLPLYVEELGSSLGLGVELLSGLVYSGQAFTMMIASPIWGNLADRLGRKLMIQRAAFGGSILLLLMAFVTSAEQLVLLRTIQGLVTGTIAANNALTAAVAPRKESGFAMGVLQMSMGVGLAVGPLMGGYIADLWGYNMAFYLTAALLYLAGIIVTFGIQEPTRQTEEEDEEKVGFIEEWKSIFSAPGVSTTFLLRFLTQMGRMMVFAILAFFVEDILSNQDQINSTVGLMMGITSATATVTAVFLGKLGDRTSHRKILIITTLVMGLLYLPQAYVTSAWQLVVLQGLTGITLGGIIPSIAALLANYTKPGHEGAAYGLDNSINAAGRTVAPLFGGFIATWFSLRATFTTTAIVFLLTSLIAFLWLPRVRDLQAKAQGAV